MWCILVGSGVGISVSRLVLVGVEAGRFAQSTIIEDGDTVVKINSHYSCVYQSRCSP